jgi:hypothetical protein
MFEKVVALNPTETPAKRSAFVAETKTLKDIAEDNLKTVPAKEQGSRWARLEILPRGPLRS